MKILLQETESSRIVQEKRWGIPRPFYKVVRQRLIDGKWVKTSELHTHIYKTVEGYQRYFDWDEQQENNYGEIQF